MGEVLIVYPSIDKLLREIWKIGPCLSTLNSVTVVSNTFAPLCGLWLKPRTEQNWRHTESSRTRDLGIFAAGAVVVAVGRDRGRGLRTVAVAVARFDLVSLGSVG